MERHVPLVPLVRSSFHLRDVRWSCRVGSNSSGEVYGTLWYHEKLPLRGVVVEWDFMYPDTLNAHGRLLVWMTLAARSSSTTLTGGMQVEMN